MKNLYYNKLSWNGLNTMLQPPAMLDLFKIVQAYLTAKFEASKAVNLSWKTPNFHGNLSMKIAMLQ